MYMHLKSAPLHFFHTFSSTFGSCFSSTMNLSGSTRNNLCQNPKLQTLKPPWPACTGTTLGFLTSLVGRLTSMVFQKQGHDHNLKTLIYHMYVYTILCFSFMYISSIQTSNTSGYGTWFQSMSNVPWKCLSFSRLSHCRLRWISPKLKSKTARQFVVNK